MAHNLLRDRLAFARVAVDATAGNGHDTLFLAANTPPDAVVWAFDVQSAALAATTARLRQYGREAKCRLVLASHVDIADHVNGPVDVAMFNLGYLPGGDHLLTTKPDSTLAAFARVLGLLAVGGLVTIVAYPGHETGAAENRGVEACLSGLTQASYTVACWRMLNQRSAPPVLYIVEKIGSDQA